MCDCTCSYCCQCEEDYDSVDYGDWHNYSGPETTPSSFTMIMRARFPVERLEQLAALDKPFLRLLKNG